MKLDQYLNDVIKQLEMSRQRLNDTAAMLARFRQALVVANELHHKSVKRAY